MTPITVNYIDHMGHDVRVADIARQSFAKQNIRLQDEMNDRDMSLIKMLGSGYTSDERLALVEAMLNISTNAEAIALINSIRGKATHWTPFAHCMIQTQCKAPIPIRTQAFKSKIGFVENEESRRYITSTPELFIPDEFRSTPDGNIKQGSGGAHKESAYFKEQYEYVCGIAIRGYEKMIESGIAPEQARFILPQGVMVNWTWTGSLAAYARFHLLRSDSHSQKEIQDFAGQHADIASELFPVSFKALTEFSL